MTDTPFWNEDWMKIQQQYWDQWTKFAQQANGLQTPKNPWEQAMEHWMQAVIPAASQSNPGQEFMQKMLEQGKVFMNLTNSVMNGMKDTTDWNTVLEKAFASMSQNFAGGDQGPQKSLEQMMGFWQSPMDAWQKMAGNIPNYAADLSSVNWKNPLEQMLNIPSFGFSRETEDKYKQFMQAGMDYQQALSAYSLQFKTMPEACMMRMKDHIAKLQESAKSIDSARELYDHWVYVCEAVYADIVISDDYSKAHGALVNALMRLKQIWGELMDKKLAVWNIPTQREMRSMQSRLQDSKREIRALKKQVAELSERFSTLNVASSATEATMPATTTTTSTRKKAVTKKSTTKKAAAKKASVNTEQK